MFVMVSDALVDAIGASLGGGPQALGGGRQNKKDAPLPPGKPEVFRVLAFEAGVDGTADGTLAGADPGSHTPRVDPRCPIPSRRRYSDP